jgi:hypothetical protein
MTRTAKPSTTKTNQKWNENAIPPVSVLIIGHRRADLLTEAIKSVVTNSSPGSFELILILNGVEEAGCYEVSQVADQLLRANQFPLAVVNILESRPGEARNFGVRAARSPLLFFLDDDIECFQDIVQAAIKLFRNPSIQAAGGANLTPPNSGALERATGGVMASIFGAASMHRRYKLGKEGPENEHGLILCNLAIRRAVFETERGFASHLISNEENVLLQRLTEKGGGLWSSPRLAVFHRRRGTWQGLCSQAAKYGAGRAQNLLLAPETLNPLYFLPLLFLSYLLLLPVLAVALNITAFLPLTAYFGLSAVHAFTLAILKRDSAHLLALAVFPCVHLAYGIGFLRALFSWGLRRKKLAENLA